MTLKAQAAMPHSFLEPGTLPEKYKYFINKRLPSAGRIYVLKLDQYELLFETASKGTLKI